MTSRAVACLAVVFCAAFADRASGQVYFTAPYGENGAWNLYEVRGSEPTAARFDATFRNSWPAANQDAQSRHEPFSGKNVAGHLLALGSHEEEQFVMNSRGPRKNRIDHSVWLGLTDSEAYGGVETASSPDPLPAVDGLKGQPGQPAGWAWSNGEPFQYGPWGENEPNSGSDEFIPREQDFVAATRSGDVITWRDEHETTQLAWVIEYETNMPQDFAFEAPRPRQVEGPAGGVGTWGVREVMPPQFSGWASSLDTALQTLLDIPSEAKVRDYQTPVLSYADGIWPVGSNATQSRRFEVVEQGDVAPGAVDDLALVAHGTIRVPEGQGGLWTFQVHSDDGFELWIDGARFKERTASTYGSLFYANQRTPEPSTGTVELAPGDHRVEFVYFEGGGFAELELSAKGPGDAQFARVGDPGFSFSGVTPRVSQPFTVAQITHSEHAALTGLEDARNWLTNPQRADRWKHSEAAALDLDGGPIYGHGRFGATNVGWIAGISALQAESVLAVDSAGWYTFGFDTLHGAELTIARAKFSSVFGAGQIGGDGQSLWVDHPNGSGLTLGAVFLEAGEYPLDVLGYRNRDGGFLELFVAPGVQEAFNPDTFRLLNRQAQQINVSRPAGLQLVPEPASVCLMILGVALLLAKATRRTVRIAA
jgi:hypothetical protein